MPGDIPELNYSKEIYVNPITYNFKIIDSETKNEVNDVTLKVNNEIINNKDSYVLYYNNPLNVNIESVPDGYSFDKSIKTYKIYNELNHTIVLSIDPIYNDYIINKTYDDIYPEENAIFELINDNNELQGLYSTNSDGKFNLHLKYGNYTLNQLKGIDGYKLISYKINNSKPNSRNTFTINLNDEKINEEKISNNNDQVDIIDDSFAQYLVSTGSNIPTIILLLLFPLICLLTKKIKYGRSQLFYTF